MFNLVGILLSICTIVLIYLYQKRKLNYWKRLGIPQMDGLPIFGNIFQVVTMQKSMGKHYHDIYQLCKNKKYIGMYQFSEPCLFVKDVNLIENIFVKDFSSFVNRGLPGPNMKSEVDFNLSQLNDTVWRGLRYKMSPAFSSGKLKYMYDSMHPCAENILSYMESISNNNVDLKEVTSRFTMDVIASCAFGLDVTKETAANAKFRKMARSTLVTSKIGYFFHCIFLYLPNIAEKLGVMFSPDASGKYFAEIIKEAFKVRRESKTKRNDLVDMMLQLKDQGTITVLSKDPQDKYLEIENVPSSESFDITDAMLISQAFTFFTAGFEGLSTSAVSTLHQLAKHKTYQQRCREEVLGLIQQYKSLTYEALRNATFLDRCMNEGLRLYPLISFLFRISNKDYQLEEGVWIKAGTRIIISTYGLHMDPNFHPNPHVFNPDRTNSDLTANVTDFTYMPFGAGPRMCIGMRMAQLVIKLFLATVLINYEISLSPKCPEEIEFKTTSLVNVPKQTLTFNIRKIKA